MFQLAPRPQRCSALISVFAFVLASWLGIGHSARTALAEEVGESIRVAPWKENRALLLNSNYSIVASEKEQHSQHEHGADPLHDHSNHSSSRRHARSHRHGGGHGHGGRHSHSHVAPQPDSIADWFRRSYGLSPEERRMLADKHAPGGLMADHVHHQGMWMLEYKYVNMYMEDNRFGSKTISDAEAISLGNALGTNRGATPTQMTMEMHVMHIMYGVTDRVTAYTMIMLPSLTMDHLRGPANPAGAGTTFTTHNSGFGDLTFGALILLAQDDRNDIVFNLSGSVPTGDIFRLSSIPTGGAVAQPLPYPMRLGSGTFDARPGISWKHYLDNGSFGLQLQTDLPIGRNYRGYSEGDDYRLNVWYSHLLSDYLAMSIRLENRWRSNFGGFDPQTPDAVISTNAELFRGGYWLNLGLGVMALFRSHLLNVELVPNLYQDLDGIQLETDWSLAASWSVVF